MSKADLLRFQELLSSDAEFQEKYRKSVEAYTGEQDMKAVFENLLLPLAQEYGLSATYDEFYAYTGAFTGDTDVELSEDELQQVAGGKGSGIGLCVVIGGGDLFGTGKGYGCQGSNNINYNDRLPSLTLETHFRTEVTELQ